MEWIFKRYLARAIRNVSKDRLVKESIFVYNVYIIIIIKNMRRPLSMKRLSMLASNFLISLSKVNNKFSETQAEYAKGVVLPIMLDFQKYCWEHKDDDNLFDLPISDNKLEQI